MRILVTGFEAFGGEHLNPSAEVLRLLPDWLDDIQIIKRILPVTLKDSMTAVTEAIRAEDPDVVLSLGLAGGRSGITVERVAINVLDFSIPDNAGITVTDQPIYEDGPDAYLTNLPVRVMTEAIKEQGIDAKISNTAGTYICNYVLYATRYFCEQEQRKTRNGFLHLPYLPEQTRDKPEAEAMELADMVQGVTAAIKSMAEM